MFFGDWALSERYVKEGFLYLENKKTNKKTEHFEDFKRNYLVYIDDSERDMPAGYINFGRLVRNNELNF